MRTWLAGGQLPSSVPTPTFCGFAVEKWEVGPNAAESQIPSPTAPLGATAAYSGGYARLRVPLPCLRPNVHREPSDVRLGRSRDLSCRARRHDQVAHDAGQCHLRFGTVRRWWLLRRRLLLHLKPLSYFEDTKGACLTYRSCSRQSARNSARSARLMELDFPGR